MRRRWTLVLAVAAAMGPLDRGLRLDGDETTATTSTTAAWRHHHDDRRRRPSAPRTSRPPA